MMGKILWSKANVGFADWKAYSKSKIDTASLAGWKNLSVTTVSALAGVLNPGLEKCGYPVPEIEAEVSDADARRRYEFGRLFRRQKERKVIQ